MFTDEQAKAVQEISKATGKAVDASRDMGGFVAKYIGGPLEQAMGMFEDHLKVTRYERRARLMVRVEQINQQYGLPGPTRSIPMKLAVPLFQNATIEEDDDLQDRWAALLVNAANANFKAEIRRAYVGILEQLTALDVEILESVYALDYDESSQRGVITSGLPTHSHVRNKQGDQWEPLFPTDELVVLSLANLTRLGCLHAPASTWDDNNEFTLVSPTVLGRAFVQSCKLPESP